MKIKHWQGYGSVLASKVSKNVNNSLGITELHIRVKGNHEYGIACNDSYTVANWLVKHFDKSFNNPRSVVDMKLTENSENGVDICDYYITYKNPTPIEMDIFAPPRK